MWRLSYVYNQEEAVSGVRSSRQYPQPLSWCAFTAFGTVWYKLSNFSTSERCLDSTSSSRPATKHYHQLFELTKEVRKYAVDFPVQYPVQSRALSEQACNLLDDEAGSRDREALREHERMARSHRQVRESSFLQDMMKLRTRLIYLTTLFCEYLLCALTSKFPQSKAEIVLLSTFRISLCSNAKKIAENLNAPHDTIRLHKTSDYLLRTNSPFHLSAVSSVPLFGHDRPR